MKRVGVLVCLIMMVASIFAPAAFADKKDAAPEAGFKIVSTTPEDGATGVSVENLSVKIYFSKEMLPKNAKVRNENLKQFKLTTKDGKSIPVKVYYSDEEEGLMMVVSDNIDKDITIEGDTDYVLTIGEGLQATDGTLYGQTTAVNFKTLDQSKSTLVYTILMVIMMVGMVVYSTKSAKKATEKENQAKGKSETVNPYKEAKRTGKSVEEIVAKDQQRKAKEAAAREKARAKEAEFLASLEAKDNKEEVVTSSGKKVAGPRPISAAGSTYKIKVVKTQPEHKKGTTNPKGQSGKQKNSKNKGKK